MPVNHWIWTGPPGAALTDRALFWEPDQTPGLWIVPSKRARDQWTRELARTRPEAIEETVWSWDDLWQAVLARSEGGPIVLSAAGARAALLEAIARARAQREPEVEVLGDLVETSGFRRRIGQRIAAWTLAERPLDSPPAPLDRVLAAEWIIYGHYLAILGELGAVDEAGLAPWASRALRDRPIPELKRAKRIVVADLTRALPATWRVLNRLRRLRSCSVLLTLPYESGSARTEVFADSARIRDRLLAWGFQEEALKPPEDRPEGLRSVEAKLFRDDVPTSRTLRSTEGLTLRGAPRGEGIARVLAEAIRDRLKGGEPPEEILVLFRTWDEEAELVYETLRTWGLPVSAEPPRPLKAEPTVLALRLAMGLPVEDWDADRLARLLRNGQLGLRNDRGKPWSALDLATAASAIRETRVFRGQQAIGEALARMSNAEAEAGASGPDYLRRQKQRRARRARLALPIFGRLVAAFEPLRRPAPWPVQVDALAGLADQLGLGSPDDPALGHLFNALEDHGAVLEGLGPGRLPRTL
ncbi:hypothetical protein BH23PLA1_BH23PLA1_20560 [soil metagenome]